MVARLSVVVGGQFGSEGKGAIAAALSRHIRQHTPSLVAIRVGGSNAGHTVIGRCPPNCPDPSAHPPTAHPWRLRHVPVAAVALQETDAALWLAPGSEVDPEVLNREVADLDAAGYNVSGRLFVSSSATVVDRHHQLLEQHGTSEEFGDDLSGTNLVKAIGSTGKGVGAARAARAMRVARLAWQEKSIKNFVVDDYQGRLLHMAGLGAYFLIEGTQGYGLGSHAGYYPFCTSGDCTAMDFFAQAAFPSFIFPRSQLAIWVVFRPFPIRVAGHSGPLNGETSWASLNLPDEHTTVTNKLRRVGRWDPILARRAIIANGGPTAPLRVALTMADHVIPSLRDATNLSGVPSADLDRLHEFVDDIGHQLAVPVSLIGTGPSTVIDMDRERARMETA